MIAWHSRWNMSIMNDTELTSRQDNTNSGDGFAQSGKLLPEPVFTQLYVAMQYH